jgi:hypothetical protein
MGFTDRILRVADSLGVETYAVHRDGKNIMQVGGSRSEYTGMVPWLSPLVMLDINNLMVRTEDMAMSLPADAANAPSAKKWDSMTVEGAHARLFAWLATGIRGPELGPLCAMQSGSYAVAGHARRRSCTVVLWKRL